MRYDRLALGAVLAVLSVLDGSAAQPPNLAGEWNVDWQASDVQHPEQHKRLSLQQTVDMFTVTVDYPPGASLGYRLDGTESQNAGPTGVIKSMAAWKDAALVLTHVIPLDEKAVTQVSQSFRLDGVKLIVETIRDGKSLGRLVYTRAM